MYTLDVAGQPVAVVNLPRHEARDYFDGIFGETVGQTGTTMRLANALEKRGLVRSFKRAYGKGSVRLHQFDGFCSLVNASVPVA